MLEFPRPRGCGAPGVRRIRRSSARAEAEADHPRSGRSIPAPTSPDLQPRQRGQAVSDCLFFLVSRRTSGCPSTDAAMPSTTTGRPRMDPSAWHLPAVLTSSSCTKALFGSEGGQLKLDRPGSGRELGI